MSIRESRNNTDKVIKFAITLLLVVFSLRPDYPVKSLHYTLAFPGLIVCETDPEASNEATDHMFSRLSVVRGVLFRHVSRK